MIRLIAAILSGAALSACGSFMAAHDRPDAAATTAYVNGSWYDGEAFTLGDRYVRDGRFVKQPHSKPGAVVDLGSAFVTPAFAEGHHHTVLCDSPRIKQFVDAGILYAAIMNARVSSRECASRLHGADGVEVVSALAGITARNAHPSQIGAYFLKPDEIEGEWVYYVDNVDEIESVWRRIEAHRPDFLKIFISYSEDYDRLKVDPTIQSWYRGISPDLVAPLVERAHGAGLAVAAHVMSAHDFEVAVDAGVDIIAHMPGFAPGAAFTENDPSEYLAALSPGSPRYLISIEAATRAAGRGVVVVTTICSEALPAAAAPNIATLRRAGVRILIGSDRGEGNSVEEAICLVQKGLMPADEVVHALTIDTPRYFFSKRDIGRLAAGAEATFVILRGDPTADIRNLAAPLAVVKKGERLR